MMKQLTPSALFADPSRTWSLELRNRLRQQGLSASVAATARELRSALTDLQPEVLVLDTDLEPDALQSLVYFIANTAPKVPIALLASNGRVAREMRRSRLGRRIFHLQFKPPDLQELLCAILMRLGIFEAATCGGPTDPLVLCVDDDPFYLRSLARVLARSGYRVLTLDDPEVALEAVVARSPDAVVLDLLMPVVSGLDVLQAIRRVDRAIPIVVLSGLDTDSDITQAFCLGATEYLVKPCDPREVAATIGRLAARRTPAFGGRR